MPPVSPCLRLSVLTLALVALPAGAQQQTLTTTFASNNGQAGNMFDLVAVQDVEICGFDVNLDPGTWDIEIYTRAGSWIGNQANPAAWGVPIATATSVTSNGSNLPTPFPGMLTVPMTMGTRQAFYITVSNGTSINYTNGSFTGNVFAADAWLRYEEGAGKAYPFAATFMPRVWNGNIMYSIGSPCFVQVFETNGPNASIDFDGVQTDGFGEARSVRCTNGATVLDRSSVLTGTPHDVALSFAPLVPLLPAGIQTGGGQIINVSLASVVWLNSGSILANFLPFAGSSQVPLNTPAVPLTGSLQGVWFDPGHPDGVSLSQAAVLDVVSSGTAPGPVTDDGAVEIVFAAPPMCSPIPFTFYGTSYTQCWLTSNGRVTFESAPTSFSPTISSALSGPPFVGCWADFHPLGVANISAGTSGGGDVIASFGTPSEPLQLSGLIGGGSQFQIELQPAASAVVLRGLLGLEIGVPAMYLGLSPGAVNGAIDPGPAGFALGAGAAVVDPTHAIYEFGPIGSLGGGADQLVFLPNGSGGMTWVGF
ncbi:MAG: hypothetical protein CMJ83_19370 [Planctomycetes bacterium]|nr:hypothetical protein [Planctomycetota bacterium]